jgi:Predicted transcriptional regulator
MARQSTRQVVIDKASSSSVSAKVLGVNLSALMKDHAELNSNPTVAKKTGMSASTIHRMRHGQVDATLRTVEKLAEAFKVQPWELLTPGFNPEHRGTAKPVSEKVRQLLAEVAREIGD